MNYMNLLVVCSYKLAKTFYLELNTFSCPNWQKIETNKAFTFAYLLMALFNKQIPIAMAMLNQKVKQTGSSGVFSPPKSWFLFAYRKAAMFNDVS